jgi:hypothetical protein
MAYDPATGGVVPSNIQVSSGAAVQNAGHSFSRPITPDNPYTVVNAGSGEEVTMMWGRVSGQVGGQQVAEGFLADGTPATLNSRTGQYLDQMTVSGRLGGFDNPGVIAKLSYGNTSILEGVDLTNIAQRNEVIPQIAKGVSDNFLVANQSFADSFQTNASLGLGKKGVGSLGGSSYSQDLNRLSQNLVTQRLMDTAIANQNNPEMARTALANDIRTMTGDNYREIKKMIGDYDRNHVVDEATNAAEKIRDVWNDAGEKGKKHGPWGGDPGM